MKNLEKLLNSWSKNYITNFELIDHIGGTRHSSFSKIKRAVQNGLLIRLKKEFYVINRESNPQKVDLFEISGVLYGPSYVSFQSALSYHQWIPETVCVVTLATSKRRVNIETEIAQFDYRHIPMEVFPIGVAASKERTEHFLIAHPWKALADIIYVQKKFWKNLNQLSTDMKIDMELLQNSNLEFLEALTNLYPSKRVQTILRKIYKNLEL